MAHLKLELLELAKAFFYGAITKETYEENVKRLVEELDLCTESTVYQILPTKHPKTPACVQSFGWIVKRLNNHPYKTKL